MESRTLTFVYGPSYVTADLYIRQQVRQGILRACDCRNITNPDSLRGIASTPNTAIRFVWVTGCIRNKTYYRFYSALAQRQAAGAKIQEVKDSL